MGVKPGEEVIFLPTHTASNPCTGKVFSVEMHHQRVDQAGPGDNVGLNIKGLVKENMPRSGDVMCTRRTAPLDRLKSSLRKSRCLTSRMRSRLATLQWDLCVAAARRAVLSSSRGKWAKRPAERKWRIHTP